MDSLCDFLSNTKLPEEKIKEQTGFSGIHSCLGWDERHMFNLCDPGPLLLDLNRSSLTQSAFPMMAIFSFKRGYSMTLLFCLLFSSRCFPFTAFCPLLTAYSSLPGAFRPLLSVSCFSLSPHYPISPSPIIFLQSPAISSS
jgi:hypothetical protein